MDLSRLDLGDDRVQAIASHIRRGRIGYQPIIFSKFLEVGEGERFAFGETARGAGIVHAGDTELGLGDLQTRDPRRFSRANRSLRAVYENFIERICVELPEFGALTFAEFGCNSGYFMHRLAELGAKSCTGYDYSMNHGVFQLFNQILGTDPARNTFRFSEWDSWHHRPLWNAVERSDVVLSVAVICHLADPIHHLAYLCSRADLAVFLWCPVFDHSEAVLSYGPPGRYYKGISFPASFDCEMRPSRDLLRTTFNECGFGDVREIPRPEGLDERWTRWYDEHVGLIAFRTDRPRTMYDQGKSHRGGAAPGLRHLLRYLEANSRYLSGLREWWLGTSRAHFRRSGSSATNPIASSPPGDRGD